MYRKYRYIIVLSVFAILSMTCMALPQKPSPQRLVNDFAGLFTEPQAARLERVLVAFDDSTSNQITVVTVNDLEGYAPSDYATRLGLAWQVGSDRFNNGIVVLVKPKTSSEKGETAIAVGYGLEGAIPDAYAKRIIENEMIPHFRNNDYFSGVASACQVLMQLASGEISEPRGNDDVDIIPAGLVALIFLGIIILIAVFASAGKGNGGGNGSGHNGRRGLDGDDLARAIIIGNLLGSSSRGGHSSGGWGSSGGGFGGGFGGFGGGSFGGGGASGSW